MKPRTGAPTMPTTPSRLPLACAAVLAALATFQPPAAAQATPYVGQVICGAFNFAPRNFAKLDGQLLSIQQNTALFSLLGTTYGGNGTTNFALPDLRGRSMLGDGNGPGLTPRVLGEAGGSEAQTLSVAQLPAHSHTVVRSGSNTEATLVSPENAVPAVKGRSLPLYAPGNSTPAAMAPITTSTTGNGQPVPTLQPYVTVNCFIALQGIFPPRP